MPVYEHTISHPSATHYKKVFSDTCMFTVYDTFNGCVDYSEVIKHSEKAGRQPELIALCYYFWLVYRGECKIEDIEPQIEEAVTGIARTGCMIPHYAAIISSLGSHDDEIIYKMCRDSKTILDIPEITSAVLVALLMDCVDNKIHRIN